MGKFKLKSPYKLDPVPRYEVPFQPDNINDESGLVAKANKNGTMIVNKNIPKNDPIRKEAESHEDHHIKDIMDGKLDYDEDKVYETISTGKVKEHSREDFNESDKNLAWEKDAYKAGENLEEKDMRPKPNKLSGPPNMHEQDTPLAFQKIGSRHKAGRTSDENKISHTERFGPSMEKPNRAGRSKKSGVLNGKFSNFYATGPSLWKGPSAITDKPSGVDSNTDISGNLEKEPTYSGSYVQFNPSTGNFIENQRMRNNESGDMGFNTKTITADNFEGVGVDNTLENAASYNEFKKNDQGSDEDYNRQFTKGMQNVMTEYGDFKKSYSTYRDRLKSASETGNKKELQIPYGKSGATVEIVPGQNYDNLGKNTKERVNNMKFVYTKVNKKGEVVPGGTTTLSELAAEAKEKGNANANASLISESLFGTNNKDRSSAYEKSSKALDQFKTNFPDVFKGTNTQDRLRKAESDRLSDQFLKDKQNAPHSNAVRRLEEQHAKNMKALKTKKFDF